MYHPQNTQFSEVDKNAFCGLETQMFWKYFFLAKGTIAYRSYKAQTIFKLQHMDGTTVKLWCYIIGGSRVRANLVPRASSLLYVKGEKKPWERGWGSSLCLAKIFHFFLFSFFSCFFLFFLLTIFYIACFADFVPLQNECRMTSLATVRGIGVRYWLFSIWFVLLRLF